MAGDFWKQLSKLTYADLKSLKESGARENTSLDYKAFDKDNLPLPREKLAPILASFANSSGGRLVFGAKEKDERIVAFEGAPKSKSRAITASIRNAAHAVQPPVVVEVVDVAIPRSETVLFVVEIRPGQRGPFQYEGRYVQRVGDGVVAMPHVSVLHAVQALAPPRVHGLGVGEFVDLGGSVRLDRPVLQSDSHDKWRCGVLLSPTYETGRVLYDPLGLETREIQKLLASRGYEVVPQTRQLKARHGSGRHLEFWPLGHVKVWDSINTEGGIQLGELSRTWSHFIADAAACLFLVDPMLIVDIEIWVWSFDRTPLTLRWPQGDQTLSRELLKNPHPRIDQLHRVADLVHQGSGGGRWDNTAPIAEKAGEYVKLFINEQHEIYG